MNDKIQDLLIDKRQQGGESGQSREQHRRNERAAAERRRIFEQAQSTLSVIASHGKDPKPEEDQESGDDADDDPQGDPEPRALPRRHGNGGIIPDDNGEQYPAEREEAGDRRGDVPLLHAREEVPEELEFIVRTDKFARAIHAAREPDGGDQRGRHGERIKEHVDIEHQLFRKPDGVGRGGIADAEIVSECPRRTELRDAYNAHEEYHDERREKEQHQKIDRNEFGQTAQKHRARKGKPPLPFRNRQNGIADLFFVSGQDGEILLRRLFLNFSHKQTLRVRFYKLANILYRKQKNISIKLPRIIIKSLTFRAANDKIKLLNRGAGEHE